MWEYMYKYVRSVNFRNKKLQGSFNKGNIEKQITYYYYYYYKFIARE